MIITKYMDVTLREFEEKDIPKKVEWINNPANNKYLHYDIPLCAEKTLHWFHQKDNRKRIDCIIEYKEIPVGLIGLLQIDKVNAKAEYYITIGETKYKHKGIATKATQAILEYAFTTLRLHKVYLTVDAENEPAIRLYEKVGFEKEGCFADDLYYPQESKFIDRERYALIEKSGGIKLYFQVKESKYKVFYNTLIQKLEGADVFNRIYIKRDDLIPFSFGGNKARKAVHFFKEVDAGAYDCVVTYGSSSSNHCRIVANMAAKRRVPCYIIGPEEASAPTYNRKMMGLFGAEITIVTVNEVHDTINMKMQELKACGKKPYFIPGGGHGNLGTQAYVECYEEIRKYEKRENIRFDYIFFASGTGTTQAGLVCGQLIYHDDRKIVGISIARKNPRGREVVIDSVHAYLDVKEMSIEPAKIEDATVFIDEYTGTGYGQECADIEETIHDILVSYGIPLDATYTGKAFNGMKKYIKREQIKDKNILFIHTGGTPLFFDFLQKDDSVGYGFNIR